ncbi:MAG: hypothetical protein JWM96_755 [Alphaproteobacteria bacterium]|nr:hypothetical protein [Alphaproteobacteria bacterium]
MRFAAFLVVLILWSSAVFAAEIRFPQLTGRIVDNAHLLDEATKARLEQNLAAQEDKTGQQLVIVTVPDLQNVPIEDFGYRLGRHWGIGEKDKDTGALLIVAPKERQVRIEVGYGLEGTLTDAASSVIINRLMLPQFKKGDFNSGIAQGTQAILSMIDDPQAAKKIMVQSKQEKQGIPIGLIIFLVLLFWLLRRSGGRGSILGPLIFSTMMNRGGGFGGGGFGGGGGSFGGGGASGRW